MSRIDDIKNLIEKHHRNLQKLKEQKAAFGLHTPPYILIEIEDAEAKIRHLEVQLSEQQIELDESSDGPQTTKSRKARPFSSILVQTQIILVAVVTIFAAGILAIVFGNIQVRRTPTLATEFATPTDITVAFQNDIERPRIKICLTDSNGNMKDGQVNISSIPSEIEISISTNGGCVDIESFQKGVSGLLVVTTNGFQTYEEQINIVEDDVIQIELENAPTSSPIDTPTPRLPEAIVIAADGINLRSGPGTQHEIIALLPNNTRVDVLRRVVGKNDWIKVRADLASDETIEGYVSTEAASIKINVNLENIPLIYEYGPRLLEPLPFESRVLNYPTGETIRFAWEDYPLKDNQYYSLVVVRDDVTDEQACIHVQTKEPETFLALDCPPGAYHWSVGIAANLSAGSNLEWREDLEFSQRSPFGIDVAHPSDDSKNN